MALIEFYKSGDVYISDEEALDILVWFFGGNVGISLGNITYNDRSFAQALMIEAIIASKRMSVIESIFRATAKPPKSIGAALKQLAKIAVKAIWDHLKPIDLEKPKIYASIKSQLARNWRSPWMIRVATGDPVY